MSYEFSNEILRRFGLYYYDNITWGSLHIVLDDGNFDDRSVEFCVNYAQDHGDTEGEFLAKELLKMTEEQRDEISRKSMNELMYPFDDED